jgi:hypothetical protein
MKIASHKTQIYKHLNSGRTLTAIQALTKFGCFRLAARIADLRKDGVNIVTNIVTQKGKSFACYKKIKK